MILKIGKNNFLAFKGRKKRVESTDGTNVHNSFYDLESEPIIYLESIYAMAIEKVLYLSSLDDSYRNTISELVVGFRYENFTLKLTRGKKCLASCGPTILGRQAFLPVG